MPNLPDLEKQIWRRIAEIENSYQRNIIGHYREALEGIREDIAKVYEKYSADGTLTYAEMSKYNRLKRLQEALVKKLGTAMSKTTRAVDKAKTVIYEAAFYQYRWAIEQDLGLSINWGQLRPQTVERALQNPLTEIAKSRLRTLGRQRIRSEITQGLIRGDSFPKMMKAIKSAINGNAQDALRIVRTEGQRAAVMGQQDQAVESRALGIDIKEIWDATLDARTRPAHGRMDGKEAQDPEDDGTYEFYSPDVGWVRGPTQSGVASFDINCRCRVREQLGDEQPKIRNVNGTVDKYITWSDWQQNK